MEVDWEIALHAFVALDWAMPRRPSRRFAMVGENWTLDGSRWYRAEHNRVNIYLSTEAAIQLWHNLSGKEIATKDSLCFPLLWYKWCICATRAYTSTQLGAGPRESLYDRRSIPTTESCGVPSIVLVAETTSGIRDMYTTSAILSIRQTITKPTEVPELDLPLKCIH